MNAWIRSRLPRRNRAIVDSASADPVDATRLDPRFDGGDHLHMSPAGNRAQAEAVDPGDLRPAACAATERQVAPERRRGPAREKRRGSRRLSPSSSSQCSAQRSSSTAMSPESGPDRERAGALMVGMALRSDRLTQRRSGAAKLAARPGPIDL